MGLIFGGAYIPKGLSTEENLHFKTNWPSLIVGSKFTVFALFYLSLYLRAVFQVQAPRGAYIWRGDLSESFLCCWFGELIFGGAYFWNFMVIYLARCFSRRHHQRKNNSRSQRCHL